MITERAFALDPNGTPRQVHPFPVGSEIASANTNVNQLVIGGTNTSQPTATTFQITGIDTTSNVSFAEWVLEITQSNFKQKRRILSNTFANPGVVTVDKAFEKNLQGNLTFILYPEMFAPLQIHLGPGATGTLTILRGNGNVALNRVAVLAANDKVFISVADISALYYKFSINAGTEIFRWHA
jgi:hypothetical protein